MGSISVEVRNDIGEGERDQDQRSHDPEYPAIGSAHLRDSADLAWRTHGCRSIDAPPGEGQGDQRDADEERTIRFEYGQIADPRAADAKHHEDQRP